VAQAGASGSESELPAGFNKIRGVIDEVDRLAAPQTAQERASTAALTALNADLAVQRRAVKIAATNAAVELDAPREVFAVKQADSDSFRDQMKEARVAVEQQLATSKSVLAAKEAELDRLRTHAGECEARVDAMAHSRSWRLTRPLRALRSSLDGRGRNSGYGSRPHR
jgi:hypothetical protein